MQKNAKENADIFAKHFEHNVFNRNIESAYDPSILDEIDQLKINIELEADITSKEIAHAIRKMANGKSPGKNGIPAEAYKLWLHGDANIYLENILRHYWNDKDFDSHTFHTVILKILPKKG